MLGKILPILLAAIGIGAGVGAGITLRPEATEQSMEHCPPSKEAAEKDKKEETKEKKDEDKSDVEFVKLNNQFVVPVVSDDLVDSLVVLSLSVEIEPGQTSAVYSLEPKLRDAFLQVLFDHANFGGFQGEFTNANNMDILRNALAETARGIVGEIVSGVLITDIARQDV